MNVTSRADENLPGWLASEIDAAAGPGAIADVARVRALLIEAACEGRAVSYSELLGSLGHRFTRPKMRALCRTLDAIDVAGKAAGEPALAALVVRESDRLPGQGWWTALARTRNAGSWSGPEARAFVSEQQELAFRFWSERVPVHDGAH